MYINIVNIESTKVHVKFQDHGTFDLGAEDFKRFLPYMGMTAILVKRPRLFYKFVSPLPKETPH